MSPLERLLTEHVCQPLVARIPARVHPNAISLATHGLVWLTAGCAALSPHLPPTGRRLALTGAGIGVLLTMIGDCLDGMHARRTGQCSKLGELLDHGLDAMAVPLAMAGLGLALQMPATLYAPALVSCAMIYQAQLLLYHHSGRFVDAEPTSGVQAQLGAALVLLGMAALLQFVEPNAPWLQAGVAGFGVVSIFMQMRCNFFYYVRLGRRVRDHLPFVAYGAAAAGLYLDGALGVYGFALIVVFVSFRICGTCVLATLLAKPYRGNDWAIAAWLVALTAAHHGLDPRTFAGTRAATLLPYLACLHLVARNLVDFVRALPDLRAPTASPLAARAYSRDAL